MCSVFGIVRRSGNPASPEHLKAVAAIARANVARGPHAWGAAWLDTAGRLHAFKKVGRVTDDLALLVRIARDAVMLVGHSRWATHGSPASQANNHPHPADGGWIVHNGIVGNHEALDRRYGLLRVSDCDTETLGLLIERSPGSLLQRCAEAVNLVDDGSDLAVLGLWSRPATFIAARRGNPLHASEAHGFYYFASVADGMPGERTPVPDNTILRFGPRGEMDNRLALEAPRVRSRVSWRDARLYA